MSDNPRELAELAELRRADGQLYDVFCVLQRVESRVASNGKPFLEVTLGDYQRTLQGRVWSDTPDALQAAPALRGGVVKMRFVAKDYNGTLCATVIKLRAAEPAEIDARQVVLFGEARELVAELGCSTFVFDIETVPGVDRRALPPTVAEKLAQHASRQDLDVEAAMGMSPLFGKVVSLAFTDGEAAADEQRVTALVVPPEGRERDAWPDWIRPMSEADLLRAFWALAAHADVVVSFHGFGFDVPFLVARSLVHEVPARVDLLSQRYRARPHLDLYRVLTNGERPLGPSGLEPWCWALGIDSPKNDMDGSMVASTYAQGDVERIALYNAADVRATAALYRRVREKVLAFRQDW